MTGDNIATLLFLLVLLTVIGGGFFVANRPSLGQTARQLGTWFLIFVGLIASAPFMYATLARLSTNVFDRIGSGAF